MIVDKVIIPTRTDFMLCRHILECVVVVLHGPFMRSREVVGWDVVLFFF